MRDICERKTVTARQRQHNRILSSRGLQLEIELPAKPLAQRETPRTVDAAAERRMHDQLHAAGFVEKSLQNDGVAGRQLGQCCLGRGQVIDNLSCRNRVQLHRVGQPCEGRVCATFVELRRNGCTQTRQRVRNLFGAPRRFAEPERNAGRSAFCVFDTHSAALDSHDAIRGIAKLKYVTRQRLHCKVFVHRSDDLGLRIEHHGVVGRIRNRAARGHGG